MNLEVFNPAVMVCRIDELESKVKALEKENAELLERLNDIESVCEGTSEDAVCMKVEKLKIENKLFIEKLEIIDAKICGFVVDDINIDLQDFTKDELISIIENTSVESANIIAKIRGLTWPMKSKDIF